MGGYDNLLTYRASYLAQQEQVVGRVLTGQKQQIATVLIGRLIDGSPVDTGEFRQGWHVSGGKPTFKNVRDQNALAEIANIGADITTWKEPLYIQNNVPHGPILEYGLFDPPNPGPSRDPRKGRKGKVLVQGGYSTQAPRGIMGDAVEATARQFGVRDY